MPVVKTDPTQFCQRTIKIIHKPVILCSLAFSLSIIVQFYTRSGTLRVCKIALFWSRAMHATIYYLASCYIIFAVLCYPCYPRLITMLSTTKALCMVSIKGSNLDLKVIGKTQAQTNN